MLKHIVCFSFKEEAEGEFKEANLKKLKVLLKGLEGAIKEIIKLEVGVNISNREQSMDLVLYTEFADKDGLYAYQEHPEHLIIVDFIKKVCSDIRVVDYISH